MNSLRNNVVELTRHLRQNGSAETQRISEIAKDQIGQQFGQMRKTGRAQMKRVEQRIKMKPLQSLGYAFAGGLLLSILLRRRG